MSPVDENWAERSKHLLGIAEGGSSVAFGELLALFRNYLLAIAREELAERLATKVNPSDVVQDTFLEACRLFSKFRGTATEEFRSWLRSILLNKLRALHTRYFETQNRQSNRERSLDDSGAGSPGREGLVGSEPTPSHAAAQAEEERQLSNALARLPEQSRQVLVWRTWEGLSYAEIGHRLDKSEDAVRMLYTRAVKLLRSEMKKHATP